VLAEGGRRSAGPERIRHARELHLERRSQPVRAAELDARQSVMAGKSLLEIL
jgi:hypothetical protein